jgi:hypothetical protein
MSDVVLCLAGEDLDAELAYAVYHPYRGCDSGVPCPYICCYQEGRLGCDHSKRGGSGVVHGFSEPGSLDVFSGELWKR